MNAPTSTRLAMNSLTYLPPRLPRTIDLYYIIQWGISDSLPIPFSIPSLHCKTYLMYSASQINIIQLMPKAVTLQVSPVYFLWILYWRLGLPLIGTQFILQYQLKSISGRQGLYDEQYVQARVYELLFNFTDLPQPVHVTGAVANNGIPVPTSMVETMQGRIVHTL